MIMSSDVSADCPTTVTVTPSSGPFNEGDVLTCTSDGYPEPSFQWTNSGGVVVSSTSTVTLSGGSFNLTCTATGNFTKPCSATNTVSGVATCKYEPPNGVTLALNIGTSAVFVVVRRSHVRWTTRGCRQRTTRHRSTEIYLPLTTASSERRPASASSSPLFVQCNSWNFTHKIKSLSVCLSVSLCPSVCASVEVAIALDSDRSCCPSFLKSNIKSPEF